MGIPFGIASKGYSLCVFISWGGVFLIVPHGINVNLREKNGPISVSLFIRTAQPYPLMTKVVCLSKIILVVLCLFQNFFVSLHRFMFRVHTGT